MTGIERSGYCKMAELIEQGKRSFTATAEQMRAKCPGAMIDRNGNEWRCADPHHPADLPMKTLPCNECGNMDVERVKTPWTNNNPRIRCLDWEACNDEVARKERNDPRFAKFLADRARWEAEAEANRERTRPLREAAAKTAVAVKEPKPPKVKVEKPTIGWCQHCGKETKGGKFFAGHDATLKKELKIAALAGDLDAATELVARNWRCPEEMLSVATEAVTSLGGGVDTWIDQRSKGRQQRHQEKEEE